MFPWGLHCRGRACAPAVRLTRLHQQPMQCVPASTSSCARQKRPRRQRRRRRGLAVGGAGAQGGCAGAQRGGAQGVVREGVRVCGVRGCYTRGAWLLHAGCCFAIGPATRGTCFWCQRHEEGWQRPCLEEEDRAGTAQRRRAAASTVRGPVVRRAAAGGAARMSPAAGGRPAQCRAVAGTSATAWWSAPLQRRAGQRAGQRWWRWRPGGSMLQLPPCRRKPVPRLSRQPRHRSVRGRRRTRRGALTGPSPLPTVLH